MSGNLIWILLKVWLTEKSEINSLIYNIYICRLWPDFYKIFGKINVLISYMLNLLKNDIEVVVQNTTKTLRR